MMSFSSRPKARAGAGVVVRGAGVVGLSIALELRSRGHAVTVIDPRPATQQATWAAAGMLAVEDPHHPKEMLPLARLSGRLYPEYLRRVEELSGVAVPLQTTSVVEHHDGGVMVRRAEWSLDPRELAVALRAATLAAGVGLQEEAEAGGAVVVHATGAWFEGGAIVTPRKGQMMRVQMPVGSWLREVHRGADVYVVPRTMGACAGTALIGATVEDVGFDVETHGADLDALRALAGDLVPAFGDAEATPMVEAWAGLRPGTPDGLPLLGALRGRPGEFVATGHFRNGILLSPATAVVLADAIEGRAAPVSLAPFAAERFEARG